MKRALFAFTTLATALLLLALARTAPNAQQHGEPDNALPVTAVHLADGADAATIAAAHGAKAAHPVGSLPRWWVFEFPDAAKAAESIAALHADKRVEDAQPQFRREFEYRANDPLLPQQWHLKKSGGAALDINAETAWNAGFTGSGFKLMVCDDSLEHTHPDLAPNYNAADSYDYASNDADPSPDSGNEQHGTATGGLAAARGDNGIGVAGVAYQAALSGIRMNPSFSDAHIASALSHAQGNIDIYSNSWGPMPWSEMGTLTRQALLQGISNGRGGKGCVYVWAAGNGRLWGDNSNNDPFSNMPQTISVSSIAIDGLVADYSERGASILVCAPAGESSGSRRGQGGNVVTTDRTSTEGYNGLADQDYTNAFGGTSASCPIVAGVCALVLQANPALTWRDVQHILVESANSTNGVNNSGWTQNGAGKRIHDTLAFGCVDAGAAVALAQTWASVPAQVTEATPPDAANVPIPDGSATGITRTITVSNNVQLEHVLIDVSMTHPFWDELDVTLTSPQGTESRLVERGPFPFPRFPGGGVPASGQWQFMTTRCWGEGAAGDWKLTIRDQASGATGNLVSWGLTILGVGGGPAAPNLGASKTSLSLAAPDASTPGNPDSYTLSGANLTANVFVDAPTGFEIAYGAAGPWLNSLAFTPTAGGLTTTIHARFNPAVAGGPASGNISHTSAGAPTLIVGLSGAISSAGPPSQSPKDNDESGGGGGCATTPVSSAWPALWAVFLFLALAWRRLLIGRALVATRRRASCGRPIAAL